MGQSIRICISLCIVAIASSLHAENLTPQQINQRLPEVIKRVSPSVVAVTESRETGFGSFSGVVVSKEGHVLAAAHAVKPGNKYLVHFQDGRKFRAVGKGVNRNIDCAMLMITEQGEWPYAAMGDSNRLIVDEPLFCISHPGLHRADRGPVVRFGKVVRPISSRFGMIQSTVKMEPGDSGGPLFDLHGNVIGIRSQIQQPVDENYDVPIDSFRTYWEKLEAEEEFKVDVIPGLPDLGVETRRSRRGGVRVLTVAMDSVADRAGLRVNDVITSVEGNEKGNVLDRVAARYLNGDFEIELQILRDEAPLSLKLALPPRPDQLVASTTSVKPLDTIGPFAKELQPLEAKLDDTTAVVRSRRFDEPTEIIGCSVARPGLIITKSSCVGDQVEVRMQNGSWQPAKVITRDDSNDLVLLQMDDVSQPFIAIDPQATSMLPQGTVLVSPKPDDLGAISVMGSRIFGHPRFEGRGYLGVKLEKENDNVVIKEIVEGGAAQKNGLAAGDIVLQLDGRPIQAVEEMHNYLRNTLPNDRIEIVVRREGEEKSFKIKIGEMIKTPRHVADLFDGGKSNRRDGFKAVFIHDAELYPHEVGGPIFDLQGHFVGLNVARFSRTQSLALPVRAVRDFVNDALTKIPNDNGR